MRTDVKIPPNGVYAFPLHADIRTSDGTVFVTTPGMLLRDWFAGQVLANFNPFWDVDPTELPAAARSAYALADAMLSAREEKP